MFGKGGGPLSAWIKEFCELVFIQTLQAFIFALTMGFIISILSQQVAMDQTDRNTSLGIICIVALTSIFKVEEIARRIFGFGPTKADHGNAVQSIGKSMLALRMGKNLLDNGKKIAGGFGAVVGSHGEKLKAIKRYQKRNAALDADNGSGNTTYVSNEDKARLSDVGGNGGSSGSSASNNSQQRNIDSKKRDQKIQLFNDAQKARKLASQEKDENKRKALLAEAKKKLQQSKAIDDTLVSSKPAVGNAGTSSGGGKIKDYNQKKMQLDDELQDKLKEIDKKKRQGYKTMISGVAETGAAMVGFTAGTAMSAASTNDWGGAVKDGITWAGTADALATGAVDFGYAVDEFAQNRLNNLSSISKEYDDNVKAAYNSAIKKIQDDNEKMTSAAQRAMDGTKSDAERKLNTQISEAEKKSAMRSAKRTAVTKTFLDHSVKYQMKSLEQSKARKSADTEDKILH